MSDQATPRVEKQDIPMTSEEKMENARNVLVVEAADYLSGGYIPKSGKGTVSTDKDGSQRIVGINDDQFSSTINWSESVSRKFGGVTPNKEIIDTSEFEESGSNLVRKQIIDANNPNVIKDDFELVKDGKTTFEMKGVCKVDAAGSDCNYDLSDKDGTKGTVHVATNKVENLTSRTTSYKSTIEVKAGDVDAAAEMNFFVARDTATYDYKRLR